MNFQFPFALTYASYVSKNEIKLIQDTHLLSRDSFDLPGVTKPERWDENMIHNTYWAYHKWVPFYSCSLLLMSQCTVNLLS